MLPERSAQLMSTALLACSPVPYGTHLSCWQCGRIPGGLRTPRKTFFATALRRPRQAFGIVGERGSDSIGFSGSGKAQAMPQAEAPGASGTVPILSREMPSDGTLGNL